MTFGKGGPPKTVYYVMAENTKGLRYGQRGGGLFTRLAHAVSRQENIAHADVISRLFEGKVEWKEVTDA